MRNIPDEFIKQIKEFEGTVKNKAGEHIPYLCTAKKVTIGWGHNLNASPIITDTGDIITANNAVPISDEVAERVLQSDIKKVQSGMESALPWTGALPDVRYFTLVNMGFQMGIQGLLKFKRVLSAVQQKEYTQASLYMLESRWAKKQTPNRARKLSEQMKTGKWV